MTDLTTYRRTADRAHAARTHADQEAAFAGRERATADAAHAASVRARAVVQAAAKAAQQTAQRQVAAAVTTCLSAVFGDAAYEFRIGMTDRRGKTEADLTLVRDGQEFDPLSSAGGGVIDILSLALRIADVVLGRPAKRRLLVLDEPCRHLSRNYAGRVAELLERLAAELDLQILAVTHSKELAVGKVIELG